MSNHTVDDEAARTEIEARVFRKLLEHLGAHPEVQNLDMKNEESDALSTGRGRV